MKGSTNNSLNRIESVLEYIENSLHLPLSLEDLASKSCWSRWQLQRIFQEYTQQNVAHYVRQQKLSKAAELVLLNNKRMIDIAYMLGFGSEISFSRAFKSYFNMSPKQYQKRGLRMGIKKPLIKSPFTETELNSLFVQIRIDHLPKMTIYGVQSKIKGIASVVPDYMQTVPDTWRQFETFSNAQKIDVEQYFGVISVDESEQEGQLSYLAGTLQPIKGASQIDLSDQHYAVVSFEGPTNKFAKIVEWFVFFWLPNSEYELCESHELEVYKKQIDKSRLEVEYWLPISQRS
ncbi:AraC family transcriptional regulator [Psychromonas sp. 14N.309.X.WAT.B.A12]|uniref:AraC family transcriptional regulator n=1 Tax=unclassified Psychromonas TaxID=2614957 RepID=UPI0025B27902|nr:AraC family transcriptional regulator [Psychromonas sp. 14N.309.X.WAT.B.A12]MDN2662179.1 AraC family transcriptional regulator [Psychromonas sp. 14N.309.X.WAT.B.A12]